MITPCQEGGKFLERTKVEVKVIYMNLQMICLVKSIFLQLLDLISYVCKLFPPTRLCGLRLLEDISVTYVKPTVVRNVRVNLFYETKFYVDA